MKNRSIEEGEDRVYEFTFDHLPGVVCIQYYFILKIHRAKQKKKLDKLISLNSI